MSEKGGENCLRPLPRPLLYNDQPTFVLRLLLYDDQPTFLLRWWKEGVYGIVVNKIETLFL